MKKALRITMMLMICMSMYGMTVLAEEIGSPKVTEEKSIANETTMTNFSERSSEQSSLIPCKPQQMDYRKKHRVHHKNKARELELNWKAAIGQATYTVGDEEHDVSATGLIIEINPGMKILSGANWDFNLATGFILLPGSGEFTVDVEGPPNYKQSWTVTTMTVGSYIKSNYSYNFNIGMVQIGLENGLGAGYFINNVDWEWENSTDSSFSADGSEEESGISPILDAALKVGLPLGDNSQLGLNAGVLLAPFASGDYLNYLTIAVGLNYQIRF